MGDGEAFPLLRGANSIVTEVYVVPKSRVRFVQNSVSLRDKTWR